MKTIILCGGQGTRIRDVAEDVPKPMIRIGNRPILWHIMHIYARHEIRDFVLCLGYKSWAIKEFFLNYAAFSCDVTVNLGAEHRVTLHSGVPEDWNVTLAETGEPTQTGGRIQRVKKYMEDCDLVCVTYGDGVADIDVGALIEFHRAHGRAATVTGVRPPGRFGVMDTQTHEGVPRVSHFEEKPQTDQGWINGGFFVFDRRLWDYLSDDPGLIFEHEPLQRMAEDGQLVMYKHYGFWQPMDTYREWKLLNELWSSGQAPWWK
ncbi:MAG: glucose-1-phosphate cytidylyltransferase [Gemmatimonadota bacterium]|nr:glucose-1-phosphate cytidylyltransferase [Gemmatimonadota bacterium]